MTAEERDELNAALANADLDEAVYIDDQGTVWLCTLVKKQKLADPVAFAASFGVVVGG